MTADLPEVELTPEQEVRARDLFTFLRHGHRMRAARLIVQLADESASLRTDAQRLDFLERTAQEACVTSCFELDGGVHLTIERPSHAEECHRNQETLRQAIDAAIRKATQS